MIGIFKEFAWISNFFIILEVIKMLLDLITKDVKCIAVSQMVQDIDVLLKNFKFIQVNESAVLIDLIKKLGLNELFRVI